MRPADFVDPFGGRPGVFHLASDHLETLRLFSDRESFCYGVNTLALAVARFGIRDHVYLALRVHTVAFIAALAGLILVDGRIQRHTPIRLPYRFPAMQHVDLSQDHRR